MNLFTYKGYTIETIGISRYIYRPGTKVASLNSDGYAQSLRAAKTWITSDIKKREVVK